MAEIGAKGYRVDVSDAASVQEFADLVVAELGGVDIVVNNAGVGPDGRIEKLTLDDWHWITDVNFLGVVHGVHAFLPHLVANPRGGLPRHHQPGVVAHSGREERRGRGRVREVPAGHVRLIGTPHVESPSPSHGAGRGLSVSGIGLGPGRRRVHASRDALQMWSTSP